MALKLSVFTTETDRIKRGDLYPVTTTFYDMADEVVVVDGNMGGSKDGDVLNIASGKIKVLCHKWEREFDWTFIGQQFQRGYEICSGDWVIHADLDFIFHEQDYNAIRHACNSNPDAPALSFWKYQFLLPDRYNLKSRLIIAVNKGKYGDRIGFDSGGDLCQPSLDGKYIAPDDVPEARIPFYNYDFLLKTEEQIRDDIGRMDRAYHRHFNKWLYSKDGTEQSAYEGWCEMVVGRFNKPKKHIALNEHPKVMQETILNLHPSQFGYNGFGMLGDNDYVSGI